MPAPAEKSHRAAPVVVVLVGAWPVMAAGEAPSRFARAAVLPVMLSLAACGSGDVAPMGAGHGGLATSVAGAASFDLDDAGAAPDRVPALRNAPLPLDTPTYDGSGQAVEPTVLHFEGGWHGHAYWMALSPYPYGDATLENPSILVSDDGLAWSPPPGLANPLDTPRRGHLSDATLVHDPETDALWVYYVSEQRTPSGSHQVFLRMTSRDGVHWTSPDEVLSGDGYPFISPSLVRMGPSMLLWSVQAEGHACFSGSTTVVQRTSSDGLRWSAPVDVGLRQPGQVIWHVNVIEAPLRGQRLAVYAAYPIGGSCNGSRLFLAVFEDGRWRTYREPLLEPSAPGRWDSGEIYRTSPLYEPAGNLLRLWYSARRSGTSEWHVGYTEGLAPGG